MREEPGTELIEPGPISTGTLLTSDLLTAFWAEFKRRYPSGIVMSKQGEWNEIFSAWEDMDGAEFKQAVDYGDLQEDAGMLVESLIDDLDGACYGQGMTFGAHPDDPALFGYWQWENYG